MDMTNQEVVDTYGFSTKAEMLASLQAYLSNPDDDTVRLKSKLKDMLLGSPKLLWAMNIDNLYDELFDEEGNLNVTGEWDAYFGYTAYIRPFLAFPETQDTVANYLSYQVSTDENMRYNDNMKYLVITFTIFVHEKNAIDKETGIARHDLIACIIRELMAWSKVTTTHAIPIYEGEAATDNNYVTKVLKYQAAMPNNLVTTKTVTEYTNKNKR